MRCHHSYKYASCKYGASRVLQWTLLGVVWARDLRVAEEEQAEDRVGPQEVYEGPTQAPAGQGEHGEACHHQEDGVREGELPAL